MKTPSKAHRNGVPRPARDYRSALAQYLSHGDESALDRAYEIGRTFLHCRVSLVEISSIHHAELSEILFKNPGRLQDSTLLDAAAEFLGNCLSPYEMAHRGFQDAVAALRGMNETLEEEIKRIAHAVHDDAGQLLVYVHLALADLSRGSDPAQKESFERIARLLKEIEEQLRRYSHELRPTILDDLGLIPAIRHLADAVSKRTNLAIQVFAEHSFRLAPAVEIGLYRVVQEALNNAAKHSKATSVSVRLRAERSMLHCRIEDNGVGFDSRSAAVPGGKKGLGLIGMRERVNALGGRLQIDSSARSGTRILVHIPNQAQEKPNVRSRLARG